jgi:TRAP-type mannitol/chloroaromatic compound transport system permease small subunit
VARAEDIAIYDTWHPMSAIASGIDFLNRWIGYLLAPIIAVLTLVIVYDVAVRAVIGRPTDWVFDVSKQLFSAHFMLLAAYGLYARAHVEVDVLKNLASRKTQAVLEILGYLVFFVPFIIIYLQYTWSFAYRAWIRGETTYGMISIPIYPVKMIMVFAGIALALQALAIILRAVQQLREN